MPFVQRVVQPVNLAQVAIAKGTSTAADKLTKFQCIPGKCQNNNCINREKQQQQQEQIEENATEVTVRSELACAVAGDGGHIDIGVAESSNEVSRTITNFKDNTVAGASKSTTTTTTTVTKAIIHSPQLNGHHHHHHHHQHNNETDENATTTIISAATNTTISQDVCDFQTNGFATSFSYATDTEDVSIANTATPMMPMKKLKQHVEFLSTAPSPSRTLTRHSNNITAAASQNHAAAIRTNQPQQQQRQRGAATTIAQSPTAAKIVSGYEFESISNITLSNALRQLASLVLIASDIFDDLQRELQSVGERTRAVQNKMIAVERRVCAYDPKMVTVPESDLLTFAQRKTHYESEKSFRKELFTTDTRPHSVRTLYDEAGKITPPPTTTPSPHHLHQRQRSPHSGFTCDVDGAAVLDGDFSNAGDASYMAAGSDDPVCTPVFGRANRKMRTRIDAEIEIRLPAGIEDLRKWTSTEALGDVTVTPDCMHHVDTSICTSIVIGDNGVLTPALSPSVLSADAVDALYSINISNNIVDTTQLPNDINKDVPLNHRLPSPEEQCKIIALRYPAEVISVDTSGKRFERMCMARKSTTGCLTTIADANNLNDDVQTVSRRSRSRKVRGKRRNTIAGIDQKEIQDAANGDSTVASGDIKITLAPNSGTTEGGEEVRRSESRSKKFGRSKSSDILKKESVALPYDKGKSTLTRLNSLKQWGRNRFKFMQRNDSAVSPSALCTPTANGNVVNANGNNDTCHVPLSASIDKATERTTESGSASRKSAATNAGGGNTVGAGGADIDDECVVHELISQKSEGRFSHDRKSSYSSSEKSMSVSSSGHLKGKLHLATCGNVKLRDTSSLNRQRRNGISANGLGGKEEQPHSSSGNWSASSESGRASIGSEITIQPKSSASNTSLNVSSFHPGSGPPSSMLSRRRFLNTSASSSVTSEGTATPELQVAIDGGYPNHLDDETSSAYSCDTEGYYTSFHMDSGLRTLKEEDTPITPLQIGHNLHTSNYSFGSQSNQTVLTAENEYELFGKGSTSTTTSSAGTVCTTLMINGEQSSLNSSLGPDVPERISSLGKLNRSNHSNSASTSTLERSYSSSTIGSTLERTGTIKRNVNATLKIVASEADNVDQQQPQQVQSKKITEHTPESHDDEEFDFEQQQQQQQQQQQRIRKRTAQPLPAEVEYSESSDLEGVERIERIKQKTAITAKRIPSMCIITPTTSDDENQTKDAAFDSNRTLTNESSPCSKAAAKAEANLKLALNNENKTGYEIVQEVPLTPTKGGNLAADRDHNLNVLKRHSNTNYSLNTMFEKLKVVLPNIKRSPGKSALQSTAATTVIDDDDLYDTAGEYVTIADISNNNRHNQMQTPKAIGTSSLGIYYSNDIVCRKLDATAAEATTTKGNEPTMSSLRKETTEYISLNELPYHLRKISSSIGRGGEAKTTGAVYGLNQELLAVSPTAFATVHHGNNEKALRGGECAESTHQSENATIPMYAEIGELREKSLISPSSQQKGARVRINAQGKFIYDSDSLKRRKGAHTTFAPGPYVKETESALNEHITSNDDHNDTVNSIQASESAVKTEAISSSNNNKLVPRTNAAKLLLLNGGVAATRKIANVRPIVSTTSLNQTSAQRQPVMPISSASSVSSASPTIAYKDNKVLLANQSNPLFHQQHHQQHPIVASVGPLMMPSPSTKSTSSTGSTISSSASTITSGSSGGSSSSKEEGYQRSYKIADTLQQQQQSRTTSETPFQRNSPVYWTLQNRRPTKPQAVSSSATSRDDLYATPIRRSERAAAAAAAAAARAAAASAAAGNTTNSSTDISPIVPYNRANAFSTSTPTKMVDSGNEYDTIISSKQQSHHSRLTNWDDNSPERFNTCADRIGQSKTSLMDFKKLLLAKSAKNSPVQKKLSAVELLKKTNASTTSVATTSATPISSGVDNGGGGGALNSSMKLLDLTGSPKTFANRRMLRQGQFGSPSKSFAPKIKTSSPSTSFSWRSPATNAQRTDIISTTIPEANSEEDQSNTSGSNSSKASSEAGDVAMDQAADNATNGSMTAQQRFDMKRNFFLQTEENNFMRGELKHNFVKTGNTGAIGNVSSIVNRYVSESISNASGGSGVVGGVATINATASVKPMPTTLQYNYVKGDGGGGEVVVSGNTSNITTMPTLETAL